MKSSELLFLQDVWRKAFKSKTGLTIQFPSEAGAVRARMQLYNAVKGQKRGTDLEDLELTRAAEQLEIVWVNKEHTALRLQRRAESDMMKGLMEAMGSSPDQYVDPEAAASAQRLLDELGTLAKPNPTEAPAPAEHQDNPFYGKR